MTPLGTGKRSPLDWTLFIILTCLWASAYPCTRLAVSAGAPELGLPPEVVTSARLTLGAIILLIAAFATRQTWPPLKDVKRWGAMCVMGLVGTAAPFYVITTAQKTVDSSLAALYVAASPLFVAALAHFFFKDERMTWRKALGLVIGFGGVAILFGPEAMRWIGSASTVAQALCLLGTLFYTIHTILARGAPSMPPIVLSAGFVTFGAISSWFGLITVDFASLNPQPSAILGVIGLGIGPTALASMLYMQLVARTSATFLSLTGYTIPVVSALIGFLAFGEVQSWHAIIAFLFILAGVWVSQQSGKSKSRPVTEAA